MRGSAAFRTGVAPGGALAGPWVRNLLWTAARAVPSLDLRFADNKSLVDATTGSQLVTFTRASSGTFVGSDGVLRTATTNLVTWSQDFSQADWSKAASTVVTTAVASPIQGVNYQKIEATSANTTVGITSVAVTAATQQRAVSFFAQPLGNISRVLVVVQGADARININLADGTFVTNAAATGSTVSVSGQRFSVSTPTLTNATGVRFFLKRTGETDTNTPTTISIGEGLYLIGAQMEAAGAVGEYIPTTSTINSAPRFDHNPTTGESLGLLVEEQRTNLSQQSENFSDVYWVKTDCTITSNQSTAPDGTLTADLWTNIPTAGGAVNNSITKDATIRTYTASIWVNGTTSLFTITLDFGGTANRGRVQYNLATNTVIGLTNTGNFTGTSGTITPYANGWARLTLTTTTSTGTTIRLRPFFGTGGESVYVWGAQVEEGAFATSYIPTTTATATRSADVASISGSNFSVSRTNLLLRSEEFDNATWTKVNTTVSSNAASAPDGTTTADKLITDSGIVSTSAYIRQTVSKAATATTYTLTVFAKTGDTGTGTLQLIAADAATTANSATSNFSTVSGTILVAASSQGTFTNASSTITPLDNDWYRCSLTFTSGTETSIQLRLYSRLPTTGDGTRGLLIWGSQLETGSAATAYIPTTSAAVTVVDSPWYRQDEGTMYGDFLPYHTAGRIFSLNNNSNSERIVLIRSSGSGGNINAFVTAGGVVQVNALLLGVSILPFTNNRAAFAYKTSDFAGSLNGLTPVTQGTGSLPTATQATLGNGEILGTNQLNGTIRRLCFWPIRLSNATLQQVTQ